MEQRRPIVVLDPGHGGAEPVGTSAPGWAVGPGGEREQDVVLAVAAAAADRLADVADVRLTRTEDRNLALEDRARLAARLGADVFVSLHADRHPDDHVDACTVVVGPAARPRDAALARHVATAVSLGLAVPAAVKSVPLEVLNGRHHVPRTASCQVALGHLTNAGRARWLARPAGAAAAGGAVAAGLRRYLAMPPPVHAEAASSSVTTLLDESRRHPDNGGVLPGGGEDEFEVTVPEGERFAGYDVEVTATTPGAGYEVRAPAMGETGRRTVVVKWWHLPFGRIDYRVKAWSSADGLAPPVQIDVDAPGWEGSLRDAVAQNRGTALVVHGWKAEALAAAVNREASGDLGPHQQEPISATVILTLGIIVGACFVIGLITLAVIAHQAMEKGYTVRDAKVGGELDPTTGGMKNTFGFTLEPPR